MRGLRGAGRRVREGASGELDLADENFELVGVLRDVMLSYHVDFAGPPNTKEACW